MKMIIFLEPDPINIPLLSVRCPFIFILLYSAIKLTVSENINSRFYYIDIE